MRFVFVFIILSINIGWSQSQLGLRLENYAGVHKIFLNPAYSIQSPLKWDVNIVSASHFMDNNYAYLQDAGVISILKNPNFHLATDAETIPEEGAIVADFYSNPNRKFIQSNTSVLLPSFIVNPKANYAFGVFFNTRVEGGSRRLPALTGYYNFDNQALNEFFKIDKFKLSAAAWSEIGFNFSTNLITDSYRGDNILSFGVNIKLLQGYQAAYFRNRNAVDISKIDNDNLEIKDLDIEFAFTTDAFEDNYKPSINGGGLGIDIGLSYTIKDDEDKTKWVLSAALVDIGSIRFTQNAAHHRITQEQLFELLTEAYQDVESPEDVAAILSEQSLENVTFSYVDDKFLMWLPTALSLQADYSVTKNFWLNAHIIRHINFTKNMLSRTNLLTVTPRFEHRWFSMSLPFVLRDDRYFRIGSAVRLGWLVLGTDNVYSFAKREEFTGTDFYIALKVNPLNLIGKKRDKPFSREHKTQKHGKKGRVKCPF